MKLSLFAYIALTLAVNVPHASAIAKAKSAPVKTGAAGAKSPFTSLQKKEFAIVLGQLKSLTDATQTSLTKDEYKAKFDSMRTATLLPFFDLPAKNPAVIHARKAFDAYQDALSTWEEDPPYEDWDTIQDGPYVTTGIVRRYKIPVDFTDEKQKDLDVYEMEDYAHKLINTFLWKYAREEYAKAAAGAQTD